MITTRFDNHIIELVAQNLVAYLKSSEGSELYEMFVDESEYTQLDVSDFVYEMVNDPDSEFFNTWFGNSRDEYAMEQVIFPYYSMYGYNTYYIKDPSTSNPLYFASQICVEVSNEQMDRIIDRVIDLLNQEV